LAHASEVNEIVLTLRTALRGEWDLLILPAGEARARVARLLQPYTDVQFGRASRQVYDSLAGLAVPDLALELAPEIEALADAVKRAGLAVTPNIVFFRNIGWMTTDSIHTLLRAPELAYAAPAQRLNWSPMLNNYRNGFRSTQAVMSPYLLAVTRLEEAITAAFYRKGVPIMAGTDSEFLSAQPGYGLHTELGIFVGLGMTPLDALKAATITSARVMGIADSVGTIEVGRVADLVLLYADPLADIGNTRQVAGSVHRRSLHLARAAASQARQPAAELCAGATVPRDVHGCAGAAWRRGGHHDISGQPAPGDDRQARRAGDQQLRVSPAG
jgi:hypothetical protein